MGGRRPGLLRPRFNSNFLHGHAVNDCKIVASVLLAVCANCDAQKVLEQREGINVLKMVVV